MNVHSSHDKSVLLAPVQAPALLALNGMCHGYFTRIGGISSGIYEGLNAGLGSNDNRQDVEENRRRIANYLRVKEDQIASPYQIHSPDALITNQAWQSERPKADALVTNKQGLALGIVTADCGPVLFADDKAGVIGAAHAGWKGALDGVLENTIEKMEELGAQRKNITAVLGPMISPAAYEVGPNFPAPFLAKNPHSKKYFTPSTKPDHHMFHLVTYIVDRLLENEVNASALTRCTYEEEENFYSYRRTTHRKESDYGRQLSAIVIK